MGTDLNVRAALAATPRPRRTWGAVEALVACGMTAMGAYAAGAGGAAIGALTLPLSAWLAGPRDRLWDAADSATLTSSRLFIASRSVASLGEIRAFLTLTVCATVAAGLWLEPPLASVRPRTAGLLLALAGWAWWCWRQDRRRRLARGDAYRLAADAMLCLRDNRVQRWPRDDIARVEAVGQDLLVVDRAGRRLVVPELPDAEGLADELRRWRAPVVASS